MAKYLKLFENHNGYTAYTADTENFILPNVSYCIQENEVHFNPYNEPSQDTIITAIFHSDSNRMPILGFSIDAETGEVYYGVYFKKIEVNGVDVDLDTLYVFDEWGDIDKDNFGYYDVEPNVFDLDGNYIKTLDVGYRIWRMSVDEDNDRLFFTFDDEIQFGYLDLKGILD
jgi:hypothetical protein